MSKKTIKRDPFADREAAKYERPIPSREFILSYLKERGSPANYNDLVAELKLVSEDEQEALHRRIKAMFRDGQLERLRKGFFWPVGNRTLVKGKVQVEKGKNLKIWVVPDDGSPRIILPFKEGHALFPGNRVVVSVIESLEKKEREGKLVEITEQLQLVVTGRFVVEKGFNYVIPHGKDVVQDVLIPQGQDKGAKDGHIVIVEISSQPTRMAEPLGKVIEILGHEDSPGIEIQASIRAYNLPQVWNEDVLEEISTLTEKVPASAKRGRLDLRDLPLVTIDGEDAKDFDDAVYCEKLSSGGYKLYVAIADVSHYVKPNTALDKEAKDRGNSVYFPGKVIPMLPEVLSNGLCSLKPDVERLCMVCIMNISKAGKMTRYEFHEGLMLSKARLTYTKVAALLQEGDTKLKEQYKTLLPHLKDLNDLYQILREEREIRGAIEFETIETRIIFAPSGKINRIEPTQRNDAHRIIEECMLCANVATAKFLKKHKLPGLYRIHEGPPEDKLADLRIFLKELGLSLGGGQAPKPLDYAKLLRSIQNRKDANIIQSVLLRSLSQAVYSPDNVGHFGLAYPAYCHFTSPIRRYPDLLVHRLIRAVLKGDTKKLIGKPKDKEKEEEALMALGDHTSMTERRADDATRDSVRWLKCEYIQKHIGDTFEGIISGVTRFGFFVELKNIYIDGLVHVNSLKNDYYYFDNIHHRLIGERTGITYKLGDTVTVKVAKVDVAQRRIDFDLILGKEKSKSTSKKGKHQEPAEDNLETKKQKKKAKKKREKQKRRNARRRKNKAAENLKHSGK